MTHTRRNCYVPKFFALLLRFPRPLSSRSSYLLPAVLRPRSLDPMPCIFSLIFSMRPCKLVSPMKPAYLQSVSRSTITHRVAHHLLFTFDFFWNIYLSFSLAIYRYFELRSGISVLAVYHPSSLCFFCCRLFHCHIILIYYSFFVLLIPVCPSLPFPFIPTAQAMSPPNSVPSIVGLSHLV